LICGAVAWSGVGAGAAHAAVAAQPAVVQQARAIPTFNACLGAPGSRAGRCLVVAASRVVRFGHAHGIPFLRVARGGLARTPKLGDLVAVRIGKAARDGFLGRIDGIGHVGADTLLVAVPPLPTVREITRAADNAASVSSAAHAAGLGSLIPGSLQNRLLGALNGAQCEGGPFPLQITDFGLSPTSWGISEQRPDASGGLRLMKLSADVTPHIGITAKVSHEEKCSVSTPKLEGHLPPIQAGPVPILPTVSLDGYGEVKLTGNLLSGKAELGATIGGDATFDGRGASFTPHPFMPDVKFPEHWDVRVGGSIEFGARVQVNFLLYGVWGPRITLKFGPNLTLNAVDNNAANPCSGGTVGLPLTVQAGFALQRGIYDGPVSKLLERLGGDFKTIPVRSLLIDGTRVKLDRGQRLEYLSKDLVHDKLYAQSFQVIPPKALDIQSLGTQARCMQITYSGSGSLHTDARRPLGDSCPAPGDNAHYYADGLTWSGTWSGGSQGASSNSTSGGTQTLTTVTTDCGAPANTLVTTCSFKPYQLAHNLVLTNQSDAQGTYVLGQVGVGFVDYGDGCTGVPGARLTTATFRLRPTKDGHIQTSSLNYRLADKTFGCQTVDPHSYPPPCTITPNLTGTVQVTGPYDITPVPAAEQSAAQMQPSG
jgi:hypothetical protein